jgi:hypothetical protein
MDDPSSNMDSIIPRNSRMKLGICLLEPNSMAVPSRRTGVNGLLASKVHYSSGEVPTNFDNGLYCLKKPCEDCRLNFKANACGKF